MIRHRSLLLMDIVRVSFHEVDVAIGDVEPGFSAAMLQNK